LLFASGCNSGPPAPPPDLPAIGGQVSLIRIPRQSGVVEAYHPDSLQEPIWSTRGDVPNVSGVLGVNVEARLLYLVDTAKNLLAVDLESGAVRLRTSGVETATMVGDGSVYAVNASRRVSRYEGGVPILYRTPLPVDPVFQTATLSDRYVSVLGTTPRQLTILSPDRSLHSADVGDGEPTASYWADLVAIPNGRDVNLHQTSDPFRITTIRASAPARHVSFSPSGHRIYIAHDDNSIEVFDRYAEDQLSTISLPGTPRRIRTDGSGRWLLAQAEAADSAWIVDLATGRLTATVRTDWNEDLPNVAGGSTVLVRRDGDLVTLDLSLPGQPEKGRIEGGAADFWLVTMWIPRDRVTLAAAAAESILVAQDSDLVRSDSQATSTDRLYLQVSSSQNAEWSREFSKQLVAAGYPARVLDPTTDDEGYRVVVGPYDNRALAEETGRRLGRPYFILTNPPFKQ
ncbi:MAG: SPOR domain-containing protein, partial [Gemmatimonadales bacterium]